MDGHVMAKQITRLKLRFGERAFDAETVRLIRREVESMDEKEFELLVDGLIATRLHTKAPLIADFRAGRLTVEKRILDAASRGAERAFSTPNMSVGLVGYLAREFPGCKTLNEAVAVRRHQIKIAQADDPSYDPMMDPKWT